MVDRPKKPSALATTTGSSMPPTAQVAQSSDRVTATLPTGESCEVLLFGATVVSWISEGGSRENLWMSEAAVVDGSKAVRGGVPLVFPVFGPPPLEGPTSRLPQHGFARISRWEYLGKSTSESDSSVQLDFGLSSSNLTPEMRAIWPCEFGVIYSITLGQRSLDTRVVVRNEGGEPWEFMWLWHTYLRVDHNAAAAAATAVPYEAVSRAIEGSPSGGYAPAEVSCPADRPAIRKAGSLSANETQWLERRRRVVLDPMRDLLERMRIPGFDAGKYLAAYAGNATALPNYGVAVSGGGWRALMNGAGALAAFDSRTVNSTQPGHLGGLLQAATYVSGLSGGSWLVGSMFINNFSTISALQAAGTGSVWQFGNSVLAGPDKAGPQILNTADYFKDLAKMVSDKFDVGFNTTLTDYWGRGLSYQLVSGQDGGPGVTFSSIALDQQFIDGNIPMPVIVADGRAPGQLLISSNTTVFEFTPFEFGSSDPTVYGFAPLRYLGTKFTKGIVPKDEKCVQGFDNAGFIMATSSSLFNAFLLQLNGTGIPTILKNAIRDILNTISESEEDIADYTPNPFFKWNSPSNPSASSDMLTLVDGGEDLQNVPLHPLIQPERAVDVIFAIDSSADTSNWPNGTSLVATYQRSLDKTIQNGTAFPAIPDQNTFINLGLNKYPTFFGCDRDNLTGPAPIIVYLPNSPYTFLSNISTFQFSTPNADRDAIIRNGYNMATLGNGTVDAQWTTCVGCAILSRSFDRTGTQAPDACKQCFQRYCWNGTLDSRKPPPYKPQFALKPDGTVIKVKKGSAPEVVKPLTWNFAATVVIALIMALI
ncbi:MAG: Lysophospholipase 1 [Geoglossum simile]|nr:MAG: Lysophospholipase 1 [Geoglossum simile]